MSGTSLDGLDLAWCTFSEDGDGRWHHAILDAITIPYPDVWQERLREALQLSAFDYALLNVQLGEHIGDCINHWLQNRSKPQFIASHGHTVFHRPDLHLTTQIGSGAAIAARTGIMTVCDFRTTDVALGGQGAPLVPIGDELLFSDYDACLNLGGFSNISFREEGRRISFDISPCNMALNLIASLAGMEYDQDGLLAKSGTVVTPLLEALNQLEYYQQSPPKSLGKEWFDEHILPIMQKYGSHSPAELARTMTEHIALMISRAIPQNVANVLTTGGGAHNSFLIERLHTLTSAQIVIPDSQIINYKEALVFAFLGMLRISSRINCLKTVTGATRDSIGGAVYQ